MKEIIKTLHQIEMEHIVKTLEQLGYNRTTTAKALGISVKCLRYKVAYLNLPKATRGKKKSAD